MMTDTQGDRMCDDNMVFTDKLGLGMPSNIFFLNGLAPSTHPQSLECFRLIGFKDFCRSAFHENSNKLTLTPFPVNILMSWHITANSPN